MVSYQSIDMRVAVESRNDYFRSPSLWKARAAAIQLQSAIRIHMEGGIGRQNSLVKHSTGRAQLVDS